MASPVALALVALTALTGCSWGSDAPSTPGGAHGRDLDKLADLAAFGDLAAAKPIALDADIPEDDEKLAGAYAFVGIAADREELADGVAAAAGACGGCHAARQVTPPPASSRPAFAHPTAARWVVWGLVWNDAAAPPRDADERSRPVARALGADRPPVPAAADALQACVACHAR